jgi:hypothetical protein
VLRKSTRLAFGTLVAFENTNSRIAPVRGRDREETIERQVKGGLIVRFGIFCGTEEKTT